MVGTFFDSTEKKIANRFKIFKWNTVCILQSLQREPTGTQFSFFCPKKASDLFSAWITGHVLGHENDKDMMSYFLDAKIKSV